MNYALTAGRLNESAPHRDSPPGNVETLRGAEASAVAEFENMIAAIARRFPVSTVLGLSDLKQYGRIGALKAYRTFGADGGASRASWFFRLIRGEMVDALRAINHVRSTGTGEFSGHGSSVTRFVEATSAIPSGDDFRTDIETRIDVAKLMKGITAPRSARIIQHRYFGDLTQAQTGERFGVSLSRINQIERATLAVLRRAA